MNTSYISANVVEEYPATPMVPRGKRSDLTEKDLEEFTLSFSTVTFEID
jgi:hypothetical protein